MARLNAQPRKDDGIQLTPEEYELIHGWEPRTDFQREMAGVFQPFADAFKDLKNTFKPYKATYQSTDDFLQPIYGVGNLLISACIACFVGLGIAFSPIALLIAGIQLIRNSIFRISNQELGEYVFKYIRSVLLVGPIEVINFALRGITQLVFTPLTWLIKMPLRGLITLFGGSPKIEDSESVQRLLEMGNDVLDKLQENENGMVDANQTSIPTIIIALSIKVSNGCEKGISTHLTSTQIDQTKNSIFNSCLYERNSETGQVEKKYELVSKNTLHNYLALFSPKNDETINEEKNINYKM